MAPDDEKPSDATIRTSSYEASDISRDQNVSTNCRSNFKFYISRKLLKIAVFLYVRSHRHQHIYQTTRRHIPNDSSVHSPRREYLKSLKRIPAFLERSGPDKLTVLYRIYYALISRQIRHEKSTTLISPYVQLR